MERILAEDSSEKDSDRKKKNDEERRRKKILTRTEDEGRGTKILIDLLSSRSSHLLVFSPRLRKMSDEEGRRSRDPKIFSFLRSSSFFVLRSSLVCPHSSFLILLVLRRLSSLVVVCFLSVGLLSSSFSPGDGIVGDRWRMVDEGRRLIAREGLRRMKREAESLRSAR